MSDKLTYNVKEFAAATGLSRSTVYELVTSRKLPSIVLGGKRLIPADAARRIIDSAAQGEFEPLRRKKNAAP